VYPEPTWSAIFTKAFALVAARTAALRTSYLTFPWPRLYENFVNIATLNVDRQLEGERVVLYAQITNPENQSLQEIDKIIHHYQNEPVGNLPSYRNTVRMSQVPWPFRRLLWWAALNILGSVRCHFFGTFGITTVGSQGAGITHLLPLLTSQLHYGMFDPAGGLDMRLSFDHRVLDGVTAALALADLEKVLLGEILRECTASVESGALVKTEIPPVPATEPNRSL
jgi:hypothetical protein